MVAQDGGGFVYVGEGGGGLGGELTGAMAGLASRATRRCRWWR